MNTKNKFQAYFLNNDIKSEAKTKPLESSDYLINLILSNSSLKNVELVK